MSEIQDNPSSIQNPPTDKISAALAKAQGQFKQPELNRKAEIKKDGKTLYETQYADLNQCIECVREALSINELSFTQTIEPRGNQWLLILTLRHASGQILQSFMPLNMQGNPQVIGGQITYYKRYQISAFFGLAADFDDDGNLGSNNGNEGNFSDRKPKQKAQGQSKPGPQAENKPQAPADVIYPFESSIKGKKIGDVDSETLQKASAWLKGELAKDPKPNNLKQIAFIYAQVKAVLIDRNPPPPDDIPENINATTGEFLPEDESQKSPDVENESQDTGAKAPDPSDYVIPKVEGLDLGDLTGKRLGQISEKELRAVVKEIDASMKKGPGKGVSAFDGYGIRNAIVSFFKSMDMSL